MHDLTNLSDQERVAFLKGCAGDVCVSYKFPLRPALAAAAAIAALGAPMAAAQDLDVEEAAIVVTAGGITDPANVEYISDNRDDAQPELPVVTDDQPAKPASANSAEPATDGSVSRPNLGQSVEPE